MSTELVFKRPGRVETTISKSDGGFVYVSVGQLHDGSFRHLAGIQGISPTQCHLLDHGDIWVLEVAEARFHLSPKEAQQVREQLGIQIFQMSQAS